MERDLGNRSGIDNPLYGRIPHLVEQSLTGRPDRARKAKRELISGITTDPFYDSVFIAFEAIQRSIVNTKNPTTMRSSILFLAELLDAAGTSLTQMEIKELHANSQTLEAADGISANNAMLQKNRYLQGLVEQVIPKGYKAMLQAAESIKSTKETLLIKTRSAASDKDRIREDQELKLLRNWYNSFILLQDKYRAFPPTEERDDFVDILKAEPTFSVVPRQRLIYRDIAGLSIDEIEQMQYPPSDQQLDRVTDYLTGIFSSPMASRDRDIIESLFFGLTFFRMEPHGAVHYRNFRLFANINLWQERFIQRMLQNQDPQREEQVKIILQGISKRSTGQILYNAVQFTSHPLEHDPEFTGDYIGESYAQHPFLNQAMTEFRRANPGETFIYSDEVGASYFQTAILPLLEQRLRYFGVAGKFADIITLVKEELKERPFSERHFDTLRDYFEKQCGQEFLGKLNHHFNDVSAMTKSAWQAALEKGLHYLPMQQGLNFIEFSEGSVPNILGIRSVALNTSGSPQAWEENIIFKLQGTPLAINGKLDQEGKLVLRAPLQDRIPGLYILLNHIAVLTFHDLVVQERKEKENADKAKHDTTAADNQPKIDLPSGKSHNGSLPRTQTDTELVLDVYRKIRQTPRRVELHKRRLQGNDDYLAAVSLFEESKTKYERAIGSKINKAEIEAANIELAIATADLETARSQARKASDSKIRSLPARFNLGSIQDPITHEMRYFETWVIEHTSPKPTAEELKSPIKLFERYYRDSSALASLDQLKPWFVGE